MLLLTVGGYGITVNANDIELAIPKLGRLVVEQVLHLVLEQ